MKQESENLILSLKFLSAILQLLIHDVWYSSFINQRAKTTPYLIRDSGNCNCLFLS